MKNLYKYLLLLGYQIKPYKGDGLAENSFRDYYSSLPIFNLHFDPESCKWEYIDVEGTHRSVKNLILLPSALYFSSFFKYTREMLGKNENVIAIPVLDVADCGDMLEWIRHSLFLFLQIKETDEIIGCYDLELGEFRFYD